MPDVLFSVPIDPRDLPMWLNPPDARIAGEKQALLASPAVGRVDEAAKRLDIYIEYKDFRTRFPTVTRIAAVSKRAEEAVKPEGQGGYAKPAYFARSKQMLDDARDAFRAPGFQYPAADKSANTGITPAMDQAQATQHLMGANPGICLATSHDDLVSKALLHDALENDDFFGGGPGMLFIEELPAVLQNEVDAYLASPPGTDMPPALKAKIQQLDQQLATKNPGANIGTKNWAGILAKAKDKGVKLYGIDGGDADPGVPPKSAGFAEPRVAKMNKLAADVMRQAIAANPGVKFVASMGAAHANTHDGGIPGLAQVFDVPVVRTDGAKLTGVPEDNTKRRMPSKPEQEFIDRYIVQVEKDLSGVSDQSIAALRGEISRNATRLAQRLAASGQLGPGADIGRLLATRAVADQAAGLNELVKAWPVPPATAADPRKLAEIAIKADAAPVAAQIVRDNAGLATAKNADGQTVLHLAARMGRADCIGTLVAQGCDPRDPDNAGSRPVHLAVKVRREPDDPLHAAQAETLGALVTAGADKDAVDATGKTAAHHAALNGNRKVLEELNRRGADFTKRDARGWTPRDVAEGSTKVAAEKFFYENNITPNPELVAATDANLSTIDALMKATRCEKPADVAKVRAAYEKLYAIKELRPVLELLALDAMKPRDPDGGSGLRIMVADADNVGGLYASRDATPPGGAYDDGAHVLMVSSNVTGDFAGTLVHEMTHAAARIVYGKDTLPYDNGSKATYEAAAQEDVKNTALLMPDKSPLDAAVMDRMSGRMSGYAAKYAGTAQKTLNQEFIVGVPQLIAQYGPEQVGRLSPAMMTYFKGTFTDACRAKQRSPDYATQRGKVDDRPLATLPVPPQDGGAWLDASPNAATDGAALVRRNYTARNGTVPPGTIVHSADQFQLDPAQKKALDEKMARVEKLMKATFAEQGLPPKFSADSLRMLAIQLEPAIRTTAKAKDLDDIVTARATTWARDAKLNFVAHCEATGAPLPDRSLAEAIVIRAENLAWADGAPNDGGEHAVEVDPKKHAELVATLTQQLARLDPAKKANPGALIDKLAKPLAGDKTKGFYKKGEKRIGKRDPDHVSIDVKAARRTWVSELAKL